MFCYDRHEEITRYIQIRHIYYYPAVMHVFCLPLKVFGWFCYSRCHKVEFNKVSVGNSKRLQTPDTSAYFLL